MDFANTYDSLTNQVSSIVSTQISDSMWNSMPGGLDKVSTSSMGFAWGIGSGDLFVCQLPCNGQWKKVDSGITDIATDDTHVYAISGSTLKIKSASNVDDWVIIKTPGVTSIVCTNSYVWGQAGQKTWRLAKPGTTGNWIVVENTGTITSSSGNALYGVDASNNAVKTDEAMQSGWSVIPDFIGSKLSKVIGDLDQSALYGIDMTNQLKRCVAGRCYPVKTDGYTPKNVTADPVTKTLWMTTQTSGEKGNIFTKVDSVADVLPALQPLDKQRDEVVDATKRAFTDSTHVDSMNKQVTIVLEFLAKFFNVRKDPNTDKRKDDLTKKVESTHDEVGRLEIAIPSIKKIVVYIVITAVVYSLFYSFGIITHLIASMILGYAIYDVYFING